MSIRNEVSKILGYTILPDEMDKSFRELDKDGRITKRHIVEILLLLIKKEQEREENE